jgi:hypothetical protein
MRPAPIGLIASDLEFPNGIADSSGDAHLALVDDWHDNRTGDQHDPAGVLHTKKPVVLVGVASFLVGWLRRPAWPVALSHGLPQRLRGREGCMHPGRARRQRNSMVRQPLLRLQSGVPTMNKVGTVMLASRGHREGARWQSLVHRRHRDRPYLSERLDLGIRTSMPFPRDHHRAGWQPLDSVLELDRSLHSLSPLTSHRRMARCGPAPCRIPGDVLPPGSPQATDAQAALAVYCAILNQ